MILRLALVLVIAAPAAAQPTADFWPLVPGNSWTFVRKEGWFGHSSSSIHIVGTATATVGDSVTVDGERLPRLDVADGSCLVRFVPESADLAAHYQFLDVPGSPSWCFGGDFSAPALINLTTQEVVVGGDSLGSLPVATQLFLGEGVSAAEGIGPIWFQYEYLIGTGYWGHRSLWLRQAVVAGDTLGQPLRARLEYMPFEEGNVWQFALDDGLGAVEWVVTAPDVVRLRHVVDGATVSSVECPVSRGAGAPSNGWQTRVGLTCTLPEPLLFPSVGPTGAGYWVDTYDEDATVGIGAQTIIVDVARESTYEGSGTPGFGSGTAWHAADGIGVVFYGVSRPVAIPPYSVSYTARLAYARVGGIEYGAAIVAGEAEAPVTPALALGVAPNPATGTVSLRVTLPEAARAGATVLDALGRAVATLDLGVRPAGVSAVPLDVRGLAPGVYTVRLVAGNAVATARLSVVR